MIENRVGELRLRIRTDLPDAGHIRPTAERVVRQALERCAALLEERMPGRVVLMRRLPLRWHLDEALLDDAGQVDVLARTAVDLIERYAVPASLEPPVDFDAAVLFEDEAQLHAAHLLALARGRGDWFRARLDPQESAEPLARLAAPQRRDTAHATLLRLARDNVLAEVLAAQAPPAVAVLASALGFQAPPATSARPTGAASSAPVIADPHQNPALLAELTDLVSAWPSLDPSALALALRVHAALLLETGMDAPESIALARAAQENLGRPATPPQAGPVPSPDETSLKPRPQTGQQAPQADASPLAETEIGTADEAAEETARFIATRCAGLFYLLDRVQELDLAESLWKACLPEGKILAAAASALLGPDHAGDPAPLLFGGVETCACPDVSLEQLEEVAIPTCSALAAALPRRGLAGLPPVRVALASHPAGRLLTASAEGLPFVFFAWPAADPATLRKGLSALLDAWPHSGLISADAALASLDTSGRLRQYQPDAMQAPPFLPQTDSVPAAALLALIAGAPCLLFASRAGSPSPDSVESFVARHLARPARIHIDDEHIDLILPANALDFDARRAGLDRDPGWLPWLKRKVRFLFEEPAIPDGLFEPPEEML